MPQITEFNQLKKGKVYSLHSHQFNATNKAQLICFDTTPLNRNISYWRYTERGHSPMTEERLRQMFKDDNYPMHVFALWDFCLPRYTITEN